MLRAPMPAALNGAPPPPQALGGAMDEPDLAASGASNSSASSSGGILPSSVRGAPPELRRLIRKRQNSESAKRCRQRKKMEDARNADELASQGQRLRRLEALVGWLCATNEATQSALSALCQRSGLCTRCAGAGCLNCTNSPLSATADADASALAAKVDEIASWN